MHNPNLRTILSEDLRINAANLSGDHTVDVEDSLLEPDQLAALKQQVLEEITKDCKEHPYHNVEHTKEVMHRVEELAAHSGLSLSERQLLSIAALFHDYGHAGQTIRQTSTRDIPLNDISNEEFAALCADGKMKGALNVRQRLTLQGLILATSFGQAGEGPYHRDYVPTTPGEKLLAFADIAGFTKGFDAWMKESLNVFREMSADALPKDFETMIKGRNGFIGYISGKLEEIQGMIDPAYAERLKTQLGKVRLDLAEKGDAYREEFKTIRAKK